MGHCITFVQGSLDYYVEQIWSSAFGISRIVVWKIVVTLDADHIGMLYVLSTYAR